MTISIKIRVFVVYDNDDNIVAEYSDVNSAIDHVVNSYGDLNWEEEIIEELYPDSD